MRRLSPILAVALAGCVFGSPSQSPASSNGLPSLAFSASAGPSISLPPATATPVPTPGADKIPTFTAGTTVATNAAGLRVRSGPGTNQGVLASLPVGSKLLVELGPVRTDGYGWYLVRDADPHDPIFTEGWAAAGFMPDPFLVPAAFELPFNPIVAGYSFDADGEFGPVRIEDANYSILWVASVVAGGGCSFAVDLVSAGGVAVSAIRTPVGSAPAPGVLGGEFFAAHPTLTGDVLIRVTSVCSWALTVVRTGLLP